MIRLYLECKCVFVTGFLTDEEFKTGRTYCPSHTYLDEYGKIRERYVKIEKAYSIEHGQKCGPRGRLHWDEVKQVYPPLKTETEKTVWDNIETV